MGFSLKNLLRQAVAQANPLDHGQTASTVAKQAPVFTPASGPARPPERQPSAPARPPQKPAFSPLINSVAHGAVDIAKSPFESTTRVLGNANFDAGRVAAGIITGNDVARDNAVKDFKADYAPAVETGRQFVTRPIAQIAATASQPNLENNTSFHPGNRVEKFLLGDKPVQSVQAGVRSNYQAHPDLPMPQRIALSAGYAAGQVANDAPIVGAAAKGVKAVTTPITKLVPPVTKSLTPLNEAGFIGGSKAQGFKQAEEKGKSFTGPEGKKQFEISDQGMKSLPELKHRGRQTIETTLSGVIDHPKLFENYPKLADMPVTLQGGMAKMHGGGYSRSQNRIVINKNWSLANKEKAILHEAQHAGQHLEGFQGGGGYSKVANITADRINKMPKDTLRNHSRIRELDRTRTATLKEIKERYGGYIYNKDHTITGVSDPKAKPLVDTYHKQLDKLVEETKKPTREYIQHQAYEDILGENVARTVVNRRKLTDSERKALPFYNVANMDANPVNAILHGKEVGGKREYAPIDNLTKKRIMNLQQGGYDGIQQSARTQGTPKARGSSSQAKASEKATLSKKQVAPTKLVDNQSPSQAVSGEVVPKPPQPTLSSDIAGQARTSAKYTPTTKLVAPSVSKTVETRPISGQTPSTLVPNNTIIPVGNKERGLTRSVKNSPEVSGDTRKLVSGNYKPSSHADISAKADELARGDLRTATKQVDSELAKKTGSLSDQEVANAISVAKAHDANGSFEQAQGIYDRLAEHGTAGGQQISAFRLLSNRTPEGLKFGAFRALKKAGVELDKDGQKELGTLIDKVRATPIGTPERDMAIHDMVRFVQKNIPSQSADKAINIWRAGLLTSPVTTGGNILGNTTEAVTRNIWSQPVAVAADKALSLFTGKRTKTLAGGQSQGAKKGVDKAKTYLKTGFDERNPASKYEAKNVNYNNKFVDTYVNSVYRWMGGQDQPFYYGAHSQATRDLARADGINQGLKGDALKSYIKQAETSTNWKPQTFKSKSNAETAARYAVYQNETGLGKAAMGAKKPLGAVGDFLIPFSQVPASVAMRIIDRTPIGIAKEIAQQATKGTFDQRALAESIGNGTFGPSVIFAGYALAKSKSVTGGYPTDPKEKELWKSQGKQANSVKVGNRWYSLNYMQPFGTLLAVGAQMHKDKEDGKSPAESVGTAVATAAKSVENQSFLQGINGILSAVNDPQRSATQYVTNTASSIVPNFIRTTARATDPLQRDAKGVVQGVQSAIPGLRQGLSPKQDMFGGNLDRNDNTVSTLINPFRTSKVKGDSVVSELQRLQDTDNGIIPTQFNKTSISGQKLTDKQVKELQNSVGTKVHAEWGNIMSDPRYKALPDDEKATVLKKASDAINGAGKADFLAQNNLITDKLKLTKNTKTVLEGGTPDYFATSTAKDGKYTHWTAKEPLSDDRYKSYTSKSGKWTSHIKQAAEKHGLDADAVLAVAAVEGLGGGVGDGGHAFGPFQLNDAGGVISGRFKSSEEAKAFAESPEGIEFAMERIAQVAKGKKGQAAIEAIVHEFERPADPHSEVARALEVYGRVDPYTKFASISSSGGSTKGKSSGGRKSGGKTAKGKKSSGTSKSDLSKYSLYGTTHARTSQNRTLHSMLSKAMYSKGSKKSLSAKKVSTKKYTPKKGTIKRGNSIA